MHFAFRHRQAICVRADTAGKHRVSVDMQMLRRDCGSNIVATFIHKSDGIGSGDMLKNYP